MLTRCGWLSRTGILESPHTIDREDITFSACVAPPKDAVDLIKALVYDP